MPTRPHSPRGTIRKRELGLAIQEVLPELTARKAEKIVKIITEAIRKLTIKGGRLTIEGFGSFYLRKRESKFQPHIIVERCNGEAVLWEDRFTKEKQYITFRPSEACKEFVYGAKNGS